MSEGFQPAFPVSDSETRTDPPDYVRVLLRPGSVIVERYTYTTSRGGTGVQWLAQRIGADGGVDVLKVCKTRHEALVALDV